MIDNKRLIYTSLVMFLLFIAGCATVPMTTKDLDADAKTFNVKNHKSNIYIYRNESFLCSALRLTIKLDGKIVGETGPKTYLLLEVDPGLHVVSYKSSGPCGGTSALILNTVAGKSYYVWQEIKKPSNAFLRQVDEGEGRKGVAECQRVKAAFHP